MNHLEEMPARQFVFGSLFVVSNRVQTMLEREMKAFDVTAKQWLLSIVIRNLFDAPPSIKDAAKAMGSSHQNVKQLAIMLQKKGLLHFYRDLKDNRSIRLMLSEDSYPFWDEVRSKGGAFQDCLFQGIGEEEISITRGVFKKMLRNVEKMENKRNEEQI